VQTSGPLASAGPEREHDRVRASLYSLFSHSLVACSPPALTFSLTPTTYSPSTCTPPALPPPCPESVRGASYPRRVAATRLPRHDTLTRQHVAPDALDQVKKALRGLFSKKKTKKNQPAPTATTETPSSSQAKPAETKPTETTPAAPAPATAPEAAKPEAAKPETSTGTAPPAAAVAAPVAAAVAPAQGASEPTQDTTAPVAEVREATRSMSLFHVCSRL
jgi:hypothetical protein